MHFAQTGSNCNVRCFSLFVFLLLNLNNKRLIVMLKGTELLGCLVRCILGISSKSIYIWGISWYSADFTCVYIQLASYYFLAKTVHTASVVCVV